jgi:hypothetical protein
MLVVHTAAEPPNHGKTNLQIISSTWKSKIALNDSVTTKIVHVRVLRSVCSRLNRSSRQAAESSFVMVVPAEPAIADRSMAALCYPCLSTYLICFSALAPQKKMRCSGSTSKAKQGFLVIHEYRTDRAIQPILLRVGLRLFLSPYRGRADEHD